MPEPVPAPDASAEALIGALLDSCCEQVLETMFFSPVLDHPAPEESAGRERIAARLTFDGVPSGAFEVDADPAVARLLAAGFLGVDEAELTSRQVDEVMAEFTNMTCGSALSSLGRVEYFHLGTPAVSLAGAFAPQVEGTRRGFLLETGTLGVCLRVDFGHTSA